MAVTEERRIEDLFPADDNEDDVTYDGISELRGADVLFCMIALGAPPCSVRPEMQR
jgi:hypothetical protein